MSTLIFAENKLTLKCLVLQTVSVWDWTTNGDTPTCSVTLDDNFGKQVSQLNYPLI